MQCYPKRPRECIHPAFLCKLDCIVLQQHPNEYIRGATLRSLQKLTDAELLEPLVPTLRACLEHRHSYVRKNAVFAVYTTYRQHENLIPDAPELIETFLTAESDSTCKRNAFVFLSQCATERAVEWLIKNADSIENMDELLQMAAIELIRKDCARPGADASLRVSTAIPEISDGLTPFRSQNTSALFSPS
jgi:coatomer subunit beta